MVDEIILTERPTAKEIYMLIGWRQWADGGSVSSGLPHYLIEKTKARKIGSISPDGFYLFQIPGTHDLVRPAVKFNDGFPEYLESEHNDFFYSEDQNKGIVYFLGDEPHLDAERYINAILYAAKEMGVKRIIGFGGVYGELPYDKERLISCTYSLPHLKQELDQLAVRYSNYQGGGSIGSYLCKRAGEQEIEYISFYAFIPTYDFSNIPNATNSIHIENDFVAWLGIMKRLNSMLKLNFDLSELEEKSQRLVKLIATKIEEIDEATPDFSVQDYLNELNANFEEMTFHPMDDFWEEELGRLFGNIDSNEEE
jgi:predicted ATP-grasp superfamily ATP-dependent carboligase